MSCMVMSSNAQLSYIKPAAFMDKVTSTSKQSADGFMEFQFIDCGQNMVEIKIHPIFDSLLMKRPKMYKTQLLPFYAVLLSESEIISHISEVYILDTVKCKIKTYSIFSDGMIQLELIFTEKEHTFNLQYYNGTCSTNIFLNDDDILDLTAALDIYMHY